MTDGFPSWSGAPTPETLRAVFKVAKGGEELPSIRLNSSNIVFGRKSDLCQVTLDHHTVSRRHAVVMHRADGTIHLMDLDSAQGTFLNGVALKPREAAGLKQGDTLRFGQSTRSYTLDLQTTEPAPDPLDKEDGAEKQEEHEEEDAEALRAQLPMGFGTGRVKGAPRQNKPVPVSARSAREAEIAAMTASMLATDPAAAAAQARAPDLSGHGAAGEDDADDDSDAPAAVVAGEAAGGGTRAGTSGGGGGTGKSDKKKPKEKKRGANGGLSEFAVGRMSLEERVRALGLPVSHEVSLAGHNKPVLALALDPAGGRILSGGLDFKLKFWDFGGMDRGHRSFREVEPMSGYAVNGLSFSPSGDRFLATTTSVHPQVFDREGVELIRCVRGDMYLADAGHTKGHTHPVTGGAWHPDEAMLVLTCASDGTCRVWDLEGPTALEERLVCRDIFKLKNQRGTRVGATSCCWDPDGGLLAGGAQDGSVHLWQAGGRGGGGVSASGRPSAVLRPAHGGEVTSVAFSPSGRQLASRGDDDTVKVWDVRATKLPLFSLGDVPSFYPTSNVVWSPDGKTLAAGTSVRKDQGTGSVKFWSAAEGSLLYECGVAAGASVVPLVWPAAIRQVCCGTSSGALKLLYDPLLSTKGALLSASRAKRKDPLDAIYTDVAAAAAGQVVGEIINPHALPMFQDERFKKRRRGEEPVRPGELRKPDVGPQTGPEAASTSMPAARKYFMEEFLVGRIKGSNLRDQDSREELIKYAAKTTVQAGQYTGLAYAHNQGAHAESQRLATKTLEQEKEEAEAEEKRKIGLGIM